MNETVTAFLKVSHNLVRTGMYSFLFVRLGIMSSGPDKTLQGAVSGPRAVVAHHWTNLLETVNVHGNGRSCSTHSQPWH